MNTVKSLHQNQSIDILHAAWLTEASFLGLRLQKKLGIPCISTLMGQDARPENRYLRLFKKSRLLPVAISDFQARVYEGTTGSRVHAVMPFGLDSDDFQFPEEERTIDVLGVGNLIPLKEYALFLEIIQRLKSVGWTGKTVIVGEGEERAYLESRIAALNLNEQVELKGSCSRDEVFALDEPIEGVSASRQLRGSGYSPLEAFAAGCKVVTRNVGHAEPHENWKQGEDSEALFSYVRAFLNSPPVGRPKYLRIQETVDHYISLYTELKKS